MSNIYTKVLDKKETLGPRISSDVTNKIKGYLSNDVEDYINTNCDNLFYRNEKGRVVFTLSKCVDKIKNIPYIKVKNKVYPPVHHFFECYGFNNFNNIVEFHTIRNEMMKYIHKHHYKVPYNQIDPSIIKKSIDILSKTLSQNDIKSLTAAVDPIVTGRVNNPINIYFMTEFSEKIYTKIELKEVKNYKFFTIKIYIRYGIGSKNFTFVDKNGNPVKYIMQPKRWVISNFNKTGVEIQTWLYSYFNNTFNNDSEIFQGICKGLLSWSSIKFMSDVSQKILLLLAEHIYKKIDKRKYTIYESTPFIHSKLIDSMLGSSYNTMEHVRHGRFG